MVKKLCKYCKWLSDIFVATCCNGDSPNCGDFMDYDDSCECWEEGSPPEEYKPRKEEHHD